MLAKGTSFSALSKLVSERAISHLLVFILSVLGSIRLSFCFVSNGMASHTLIFSHLTQYPASALNQELI